MKGPQSHRFLLELGRGGMGVVFLAEKRDPGGGRSLVVVKRLRPELAAHMDARNMFLEEGRLTMRLHSPRVVTTLDVGFDGQSCWLEMEYLEGLTFRPVLRAGPPLRIGLFVLAAALEGLHAAHELTDEQGEPLHLVHRDVSPHNLIVTYDGNIKLIDFGIAKTASSASRTRTGAVRGKLTYMAPEQILRRDVDRRADVFAAGLILFELLHGQRFWGELSDEEVYVRLRFGDVSPVSPMREDAPSALVSVCRKATQSSREERFSTADEMRLALLDAARGEGGVADSEELARYLTSGWSAEREGVRARVATLLADQSAMAHDLKLPIRGLTDSLLDRRLRPSPPPSTCRKMFALALTLLAASCALYATWHRTAGLPPSAPAVVRGRCGTNAECSGAQEGGAWLCRGSPGHCVAAVSEDCHLVSDADSLTRDDTIWIGALFPLTGPDAQKIGEPSMSAIDLARRDFLEVSGGIPNATDGMPPHGIGIVACEDSVDPARAAHFLADEFAVPAVVGFGSREGARAAAISVFLQREILVISALDIHEPVADPRDGASSTRLWWRTASSGNGGPRAVGALLHDWLGPRLRAGGAPGSIAVLRDDTRAGLAARDALVSNVRARGSDAAERGAAIRDVVLAAQDNGSTPPYGSAVHELLETLPEVIVILTDHASSDVLQRVEAEWPMRGEPRPWYVVPPELEDGFVVRSLGKNEKLAKRVLPLAPRYATEANARFTMHYNESLVAKVSMATSPAAPYDSFYLLAYAAAAAGSEPITGTTMARAIARLVPPGNPVEVGPSSIFAAFAALRAGENIDLQGAASPLDLDPSTGETMSDFVVPCVGADGRVSARAIDRVDSGLVYEGRSQRWVGEYKCP